MSGADAPHATLQSSAAPHGLRPRAINGRDTHGLSTTRQYRPEGFPRLPRHDDVRALGQQRSRRLRAHHRTRRSTRASTSSTPPTATTGASRRRSSARRCAAARQRRAGDQGVHAGRRRRARPRHLAPPHHAAGRGEPAPHGHGLDRPLPAAPSRQGHADRGGARARSTTSSARARCATSASPPGTPPIRSSCSGRAGAWSSRCGPASARASSASSATQPPYSIFSRDVERDVFPVCETLRHRRHRLEPARGRLARRPLSQGPAGAARLARRQRDRVRHVRPRQLRSRQPARPAPPGRRRGAGPAGRRGRRVARRLRATPGRCATPPSPAPSSARASCATSTPASRR